MVTERIVGTLSSVFVLYFTPYDLIKDMIVPVTYRPMPRLLDLRASDLWNMLGEGPCLLGYRKGMT